jgi:acyl-CoA synthetase (NDP forming)
MTSDWLPPLLAPRSIAVVGASPREGNFGRSVLRILREDEFAGRLYAVNPQYQQVEGVSCFPSLAALPQATDVAVLAVGNDRIEQSLQAAVASEARSAVIYGSCHLEGDPTLVERLRKIATAAKLPVCGGNSAGFCNYERGLRLTAWPAVKRPSGGVTLLAHSGSVFSAMTRHDFRLRYNLAISVGQETSVTVADYMTYALDLESTKAIAVFIEGVRDGERFVHALKRARSQNVPVVMLKVGRTDTAARMAISHTGALAEEDHVFDAVCRRYGVLRVSDLDELAATTILLQSGRRAAGGALVSVHESGGERELVVDLAQDKQVPFAHISPETISKLRSRLEYGLDAENPCDVFGTGRDYDGVLRDCFAALLADPGAAAGFFFFDIHQSQDYSQKCVAACLEAARTTDKLVGIATNYSGVDHRELALELTNAGLPVIDGTAPALVAIRNMFALRDYCERDSEIETISRSNDIRDFWRRRFGEPRVLEEPEALMMLSQYGIQVVPHEVINSAEEAVESADRLTYPVVLKTAAPGILHKSDVGGVYLSIKDQEGLKRAYADLAAKLGTRAVIAKEQAGGIEMIVGVRSHAKFGPLVVIGSGGVLVEMRRDFTAMLAPVSPYEVRCAIERLHSWKLLNGYRGKPAVSVHSLVDLVVRVSTLAADLGSACEEGDLNPVLVSKEGAIVLDALFVPSTCVQNG